MKLIYCMIFCLLCSVSSVYAGYTETTYYVYVCHLENDKGEFVVQRISNVIEAGYNNTNGMSQQASYFVRKVEPPKETRGLHLTIEDPTISCWVNSSNSLDAVTKETKSHWAIREKKYQIIPGASKDNKYFYKAKREIDISPYLQ